MMNNTNDAVRSAFDSKISGPTIAELIEAGMLAKPGDPPAEVGWFDADKKPARPGAYRTRVPGLGVGFSYFDGEWGNQARDAAQAAQWWDLYGASGVQVKEWCGLAEAAH